MCKSAVAETTSLEFGNDKGLKKATKNKSKEIFSHYVDLENGGTYKVTIKIITTLGFVMKKFCLTNFFSLK